MVDFLFIVKVAKFGVLAGCRVPNAFNSRSESLSDLKLCVQYPVFFVIRQPITVKASENFSLQWSWHLAVQYGLQPIIVLNKSHRAFKGELTKLMESNVCALTEPQVIHLLCLDMGCKLWYHFKLHFDVWNQLVLLNIWWNSSALAFFLSWKGNSFFVCA